MLKKKLTIYCQKKQTRYKMLQLNKEELQTLLNACKMARGDYMDKISTLPFFQRKQEPTFAEYQRHKNFPFRLDNEIRWEKAVFKLNDLILKIDKELSTTT